LRVVRTAAFELTVATVAGVLYVSVAVMRVGWYEGDADAEGEDVEDARGDGEPDRVTADEADAEGDSVCVPVPVPDAADEGDTDAEPDAVDDSVCVPVPVTEAAVEGEPDEDGEADTVGEPEYVNCVAVGVGEGENENEPVACAATATSAASADAVRRRSSTTRAMRAACGAGAFRSLSGSTEPAALRLNHASAHGRTRVTSLRDTTALFASRRRASPAAALAVSASPPRPTALRAVQGCLKGVRKLFLAIKGGYLSRSPTASAPRATTFATCEAVSPAMGEQSSRPASSSVSTGE
jgi:hypothetical protein